jgi:hypothetical protein
MKKNQAIIVAVVVVLAGGAIAAYSLNKPAPEAPAAPVEQVPTPEQAATQQQTFNKKFEDVLNDFLQTVQIKAMDYKNRRKVIAELVKPENLGNPTYIQENNLLMQTLIPELKVKMDEIMAVFNDGETNIRQAIASQPSEKQQAILDQWRSVRDKQASHYLAFFASEQDILTAYQELMDFYQSRQGAYVYDDGTLSLLFSNPADKPQERMLRERIQDMEAAQAEAIKNAIKTEPVVSQETGVPLDQAQAP